MDWFATRLADAAAELSNMFTDKHVTVSTRVVKVVGHSHKEWLLISTAVVNSFVGIERRGRWKYVYGQTSSTTHPGVVRQQLAKEGLSLISESSRIEE